jgi:polysaccharide chain length determinant protein (PEP-CTERM system associated)
MHDLMTRLLIRCQGMWRYRWQALLVAWVVAVIGSAAVYALPDKYEAKARVSVDTQSVLKPLLHGLAVEPDIATKVKLMTQALLSRPNLEKVVHQTDLDLRAKTPVEMQTLLARLEREITVTGYGGENVYAISYQDKNAKTAQRVVQTLLNVLVEGTLGSNRLDTAAAQRFLHEQIHEYESRLADSEQRLAEFKKTHVGLMPGQGGDYYARLQTATQDLEQTQAKLKDALSRRDELRRQLAGETPTFGIVSPTGTFRSSAATSDPRLRQYQDKLDQLLLDYTDNHPDVIALKQTIARLKEEARQEKLAHANDPKPATTEQPLELNPVYQRMQIGLNDSEVDVAALQGQVRDKQNAVNELKRMVTTIPEVEAQLTRLNRDYVVTKAQYDALVQRLETARLSQDAEQSREDVKFDILDPPVLPLTPIGPKRRLYLAVLWLAALGIGASFAFMLDELRPVFFSARALREATGRPVLGSISMKFMPEQRLKLKKNLASFVLLTILFLFAYGGAVLLQHQGVRLAQALLQTV